MPRAMTWSDAWVAKLEHPRAGQPEIIHRDPSTNKLRLVVKRTKKVFEVQAERPARFGGRKTYVVQIGTAPPMKVEEARESAGRILGQIRNGEAPRANGDDRPAVTTLGSAWQEYKARGDLRPRTRAMYESTYDRCLSHWADMPLATLLENPVMARDEHRRLTQERGPVTANKAMTLLRSIYRHAAQLDTSLSRVRHLCEAVEFHKEQPRRDAAIPAALMPSWARQVEAMRKQSPIRASFHMLCLRLGCRPGELAARKWSDIDREANILVLPETKTHLVEVPLTLQILRELERVREAAEMLHPESDFIFPARAGGHLSRYTEPKRVLSHSGNCGRHTHHTIGTVLGRAHGIEELHLDVLEGRSLMKAGAAGRGYITRSELGPKVRAAQVAINNEIDRLFGSATS